MVRFAFALGMCWVLASCQNSASLARGVDDGTVERFQLRGVVVRKDSAHRIVTIKHGPVVNSSGKVWMEAMTMEFPVPGNADIQMLNQGVSITGIVASRASDFEYWIENVRLAAP